MTRGNLSLECPNCEWPSLRVVRSDIDESNIGMRRYQCKDCRNYFTTLEVLFTDDEGNPDCFNQLALNYRIYDREKYHKRSGHTKPRRQLKTTDQIRSSLLPGHVTLSYKRNPRKRAIFWECLRGHAFDEENTYVNPNTGGQTCRACRKINQRNWYDRNRDKIRAYDRTRRTKMRALRMAVS